MCRLLTNSKAHSSGPFLRECPFFDWLREKDLNLRPLLKDQTKTISNFVHAEHALTELDIALNLYNVTADINRLQGVYRAHGFMKTLVLIEVAFNRP